MKNEERVFLGEVLEDLEGQIESARRMHEGLNDVNGVDTNELRVTLGKRVFIIDINSLPLQLAIEKFAGELQKQLESERDAIKERLNNEPCEED